MKIIDLMPQYEPTYFNCLEDWSEEMKEAGDHKACWYHVYRQKGLRVKIALKDEKTPVGMIQYLPIEESIFDGRGLYVIMCIWVHGYKEGIGNYQGMGQGEALLKAAEQDARERGALGMAAWGLWLPFWMKASWFKKQGYKKADRDALALLVWKSFYTHAEPPVWIKPRKKVETVPGKVTVTAFKNGWCSAQNIVFERVKKASADFGERVIFRQIDTSDRKVFLDWGIADAIFIDGTRLSFGPPLSYEKIFSKISKRVRKLKADSSTS